MALAPGVIRDTTGVIKILSQASMLGSMVAQGTAWELGLEVVIVL
jgi:hypothetical protein